MDSGNSQCDTWKSDIPDEWWTNGYCSIFAYALKCRFRKPMYAILEIADKDKDATLFHAVVVHDGKAYDADGVKEIDSLIASYPAGVYYPGEPSKVVFRRISVERLGDIHHDFCTDDEFVNQAFDFIDRHPERFADLTPSFQSSHSN